MKHTKFFLIIATAIILCACEKPTDDRQHQTPEQINVAFLLNLQVTKIPVNGSYYDCQIPTCKYDPKQLYTQDLPEMYRIQGGLAIWANKIHYINVFKQDSLNADVDTLLYNYELPSFNYLVDSLKAPQYIDHEENGFAIKMEFRYD